MYEGSLFKGLLMRVRIDVAILLNHGIFDIICIKTLKQFLILLLDLVMNFLNLSQINRLG